METEGVTTNIHVYLHYVPEAPRVTPEASRTNPVFLKVTGMLLLKLEIPVFQRGRITHVYQTFIIKRHSKWPRSISVSCNHKVQLIWTNMGGFIVSPSSIRIAIIYQIQVRVFQESRLYLSLAIEVTAARGST
jgi:hypothetical protein